ncbi:MAG: hypothetical protein P8186_13275 [Anaerolineae bacterium]
MKQEWLILGSFAMLALLTAQCRQQPAASVPSPIIQTVVVTKEVTVEVEKVVEVEKEVTRLVEVETATPEDTATPLPSPTPTKETVVVVVTEVVTQVVTATPEPTVTATQAGGPGMPTPWPTVDYSNPVVALVWQEVPHVWHQMDPVHGAIQVCVAIGLEASLEALDALEETYGGPIVIGPDVGDYSVWGGEALIKRDEGQVMVIPARNVFFNPDEGKDGTIYTEFTVEQLLVLLQTGDAVYTGKAGGPGSPV